MSISNPGKGDTMGLVSGYFLIGRRNSQQDARLVVKRGTEEMEIVCVVAPSSYQSGHFTVEVAEEHLPRFVREMLDSHPPLRLSKGRAYFYICPTAGMQHLIVGQAIELGYAGSDGQDVSIPLGTLGRVIL